MDQSRVKELYEKYGFLIYGRCMRILCSEQDAKDAMQEIFIKLIDNINKFEDREHIIPWIYTVSKNHCFNILRQRKKMVSIDSVEDIKNGHEEERAFSDKQLIGKILGLHNKRIQEAVYYTYIEELNQNEIQKLTGQSPATVRRNLKKFKESLPHIKKRLEIE